ncbi:TraB/GumN family protein [Tropicibacter sp. Alg240-R139]|uniref:TraB/GumN family protein n=1 Tax=Tropicibacter sp. Alg240-R139 TaxID=2305991 RepID=UPI0013E090C5|nr:TraB/GumN family protein [Tropicibacter sp. Alg240-R139]
MLRLFVFVLFGLTFASAANAQCQGTDLRDRLTPSAQERLKQEITKVPFAYGNHWVATKGKQRINVIGTQHTGDSRMRSIMRTLRPVIERADAVLLEVTRLELAKMEQRLRDNRSLFLITKGPTLPKIMSKSAWTDLSVRMELFGYEPEQTARIQPWYLSLSLAQSGCGGRGFASYSGLDDRIEDVAIRNRIPIGSLERSMDGMRALAKQSIRDQAKLLELDLASGLNIDDQVVTQRNAYFNETLAEALLIKEWTMYRDIDISRSEVVRLLRQFDDLLLDRRNKAWMPVIIRTKGNNLVVAVGAAHLPGRNGILNLLSKRGYTLTRASF